MYDFRDVKSYSDMSRFLAHFDTLDQGDKDEILREMVGLIASYKATESQTDLFSGNASAGRQEPLFKSKARSRRPSRSRRRV